MSSNDVVVTSSHAQLMNQLDITEGDIIVVENASLPLATFSKFEPQSKEFLDISNPKAVYPPYLTQLSKLSFSLLLSRC